MFPFKYARSLGILFFLSACAPGPTQQVPPEYQEGQKLFHRVCSNCHGSDAMGGQTKAPRLIDPEYMPPNFTDEDIRDTIINGSSSGKMPPQRVSFNDRQITEIIKYLRYAQRAAGLSGEEDEEEEEELLAGDEEAPAEASTGG